MRPSRRLLSISATAVALAAAVSLPRAARADVTTVTTTERPALPEAPRPFHGRGRIYLHDVVGISTFLAAGGGGSVTMVNGIAGYSTSETRSPGGAPQRGSSVWLAPSVDFLVTDRLTLGGTPRFSRTWFDGAGGFDSSSGVGLGLSPRVGWVVPLGASTALWPRAGLELQWSSTEVRGTSAAYTTSSLGWGFDADAAVLYSLGQHGYLSLGPSARYFRATETGAPAFSGDRWTLSVAMRGGLGLRF